MSDTDPWKAVRSAKQDYDARTRHTSRCAVEVVVRPQDVEWSEDGLSGTVPCPVVAPPEPPWPADARIITVWRGTFSKRRSVRQTIA